MDMPCWIMTHSKSNSGFFETINRCFSLTLEACTHSEYFGIKTKNTRKKIIQFANEKYKNNNNKW